MSAHDLGPETLVAEDEREVTWRARCKGCGLSWRSLTDRDLRFLTEESWCLGRPERWHRCQYSGAHCVGQDGHEACVPLLSSSHADWTCQPTSPNLSPDPIGGSTST